MNNGYDTPEMRRYAMLTTARAVSSAVYKNFERQVERSLGGEERVEVWADLIMLQNLRFLRKLEAMKEARQDG